ncbi:MAG TPA: M12 family metallo-peptidase [Thermoanaerobaculia bacterium]
MKLSPACRLFCVIAPLIPARAATAAGQEDASVAPFPLPLLGWSDAQAGGPAAAGPASPTGAGGGPNTALSFGGLSEPMNPLGPSVIFPDVPLPDGTSVTLSVEQVDPSEIGFGFHVDGQPAQGLLAELGLSVYVGKVVGVPNSETALAFSKYGSRGWIQREDDLFHLLAQPGANGNWKQSTSQMVSEATLWAWGNEPEADCRTSSLPPMELPSFPGMEQKGQGKEFAVAPDLLDCSVAIETDDQLYQVFGDVNAEAAYVTTLLTWVSYRYEEQIQTVLTYPYVMFHTQGTDPWTSQENGGDAVSLLFELQAAWQFNVPNGAQLGAFVSGAPLGGGVAWLPGLCNAPYNFSVSSHIAGTVQFPVVQQGGNWDFIVLAHEIGHNFFAIHTHDYCPTPLDECAPLGYLGYCQTQQVCSNQGTVMSYCHTCSPGTANITTYFHPESASDMREWAALGLDPFSNPPTYYSTCLPLYVETPVVYCTAKVNSQGCTPAIGASGHATLSGLDDFHITATDIINQQDGLLYFGLAQTNKPFQGGTKCVLPPTSRTSVQNSLGSAPGLVDCSGTYDLTLSHLLMANKGLSAGMTVYAQYWSHDPQALSGTNLTDAIQFHVEN